MRYELEIKLPDGASADTTPNAEVKDISPAPQMFIATQVIKPFIEQGVNFTATNVKLVTGSQELQDRANVAATIVNKAVDIGSNVLGGATIGAALGIAGGGWIGLALSLAHTGVDIALKQRQITLERDVENVQLSQIRERSGLYYNRSRN